jgi:hypothetical protein
VVAAAVTSVGCAASAPWLDRGCPVAPSASLGAAAAPAHPGSGVARNVILVTIDGTRWQEIFGGVEAARARSAGLRDCDIVGAEELLPNLRRWFVDGGVVVGGSPEAPMLASGPSFVSLPGYQEIFTGRASSCTSNLCPHMDDTTLLDELAQQQRLAPEQVAVITSWERIERVAARAPERITLSTGRHHGAGRERLRVNASASQLLDEAAASGAGPGWLDYRADRFTAALALRYLAAEHPRFLFVGLGDTDEYAHAHDYAGYLEALRRADHFVGELMQTLAQLGEYGEETAVLVTADHGRAADFSSHGAASPESARVWLLAAGAGLPAHGGQGTGQIAHLADIAPTVRRWLGLADDFAASAGRPIAALASPAAGGTLFAHGTRAH